MTIMEFFKTFDLFADAPNAVEKMRELVLSLAVQGKLVRQNPSDEPAEALFRRICAERDLLVTERKTRQKELLGPITVDDVPFAIPSCWKWCRLADICFLITDGAHHTPTYVSSGVPFLSVKDVSGGVIDFSSTRFISENAHRELCKRCRPERGDILLTKVGTTGIAVAVDDEREFSIFVSLALLKFSKTHLNRGFLRHLINSPFVKKQSAENTQGIGNKNLVLRLINQFKVPVPPLAEQRRIVAKVDELMALCDRLEAQHTERDTRHATLARASLTRFAEAPTPTNLNLLFHKSYDIDPADLRKSILTLAVQGKLVPQNPNDKPAEVHLRSCAELPEGHIRRRKIVKKPRTGDTTAKFAHLPPSWECLSVQNLYDLNVIIDYADGNHGSLYPRKEEFGDSGVQFVTARDIVNGRVAWTTCARLRTDRADQLTKGWSQGGDVLLTHNATVGRVARVEHEAKRFLLGTSVTFYRLNDAFINRDYFYYVLSSPCWQDQLASIMQQTTRNQVSIQKQAHFDIPVPPIREQFQIAAKVDELMKLVDALEKQLEESRTRAAELMEAVVAELTANSI